MSVTISSPPVNPAYEPGIRAMVAYLVDRDYCSVAIGEAKAIVRRTGCVADAVPTGIDREHVAGAEEAYVDALPPVAFDDATWSDPGIYLDFNSIDAASRRVPRTAVIVPPDLIDDDAFDDERRYPFLVRASAN